MVFLLIEIPENHQSRILVGFDFFPSGKIAKPKADQCTEVWAKKKQELLSHGTPLYKGRDQPRWKVPQFRKDNLRAPSSNLHFQVTDSWLNLLPPVLLFVSPMSSWAHLFSSWHMSFIDLLQFHQSSCWLTRPPIIDDYLGLATLLLKSSLDCIR